MRRGNGRGQARQQQQKLEHLAAAGRLGETVAERRRPKGTQKAVRHA
jgi:hypothetical protein